MSHEMAVVIGPMSSKNTAVALFQGTSGQLLQSSNVTITSSGKIRTPAGAAVAPSYSFTVDPSSGLFLGAVGELSLSAAGKTCVTATCDQNVVLTGTKPADYGAQTEGKGCVFIHQVSSIPQGVPNAGSGGILYVHEDNLFFLNSAGACITLTQSSSRNDSNSISNAIQDNGSAQSPAHTFINDTSSGMYLLNPGYLGISTMGCNAVVVTPKSNISVCGDGASNYGSDSAGEGVLYINEAVVKASGIPNGGRGGILYVDGESLNFLNSAGVVCTLNSERGTVLGPGVSVNRAVVLFNGTTGQSIQNSVVTVSLAGVINAGNGAVAFPAYSFSSDTTSGMHLSRSGHIGLSCLGKNSFMVAPNGNTVFSGDIPTDFGALIGGKGVVFIHAAATVPSGIPNGGSGGVLYVTGTSLNFLNSAGVVVTIGGSGGVVVGPTVATHAAVAVFSGSSGKILQNSATLITPSGCINTATGSIATPAYSFSNDVTTGMYLQNAGSLALSTLGLNALVLTENSNVSLAGNMPTSYGGEVEGQGVIFINEATIIPSGVPNDGSGGILYVTGTTLNFLNSAGGVVTISSGSGNVIGPTESTDLSLAVFNGTTGTALSSSIITVTQHGVISVSSGTDLCPSYTFLDDGSSGLHLLAVGKVSLNAAGAPALIVAEDSNVAMCGPAPSNYGQGKGCVYINNVSLCPSGVPNNGSGGVLFVSGTSLNFLNSSGKVINLTSASGNIIGPSSATNTAVAIFNGVSGTLLENSYVTVSPAGALASVNGSTGVPTYSFTSDKTSGMFLISSKKLGFTAGGVTCAVADANSNFSIAGHAASNYGIVTSGQGVVFINQAIIPPVGIPNGGKGGILYVQGADLNYLNSAGAVTTLTGYVSGPKTSTHSAIALFNGSDGSLLQSSSVAITEDGNMLTVDGSNKNPAYSFANNVSSGIYLSSSGDVSLTVNSLNGVCVSAESNVSLAGSPSSDYAGGKGVVFINSATEVPSGEASGGGVLYVSGPTLNFLDSSGTNSVLNYCRCIFYGTLASAGSTDIPANQLTQLSYLNIIGNTNGTFYNSVTNHIVAPVSGVYMITATFRGNNNVFVNGEEYGEIFNTTSGITLLRHGLHISGPAGGVNSHCYSSSTVTVPLHAGDQICINFYGHQDETLENSLCCCSASIMYQL